MKRKRNIKPWTLAQVKRREFEPKLEDGCVLNGCIPQDDYAEEVFETLESSAVSFGTVWERGEMPVLKMDDAFRSDHVYCRVRAGR